MHEYVEDDEEIACLNGHIKFPSDTCHPTGGGGGGTFGGGGRGGGGAER